MIFRDMDTEDTLRQFRKEILTYRGLVVKVIDVNDLNSIKSGLDEILDSMDSEPSLTKDNLIYACGRYTKSNLEEIQRYIAEHDAVMYIFKGKQADFDGPYWIENASID